MRIDSPGVGFPLEESDPVAIKRREDAMLRVPKTRTALNSRIDENMGGGDGQELNGLSFFRGGRPVDSKVGPERTENRSFRRLDGHAPCPDKTE